METIPILGFAGYSGSGKTTLIEALIPLLGAHGLRVAVIKHDGHDFEADRAGSDSHRFTAAGAAVSLLASAKKAACFMQGEADFLRLVVCVRDVDLILVEGFKQLPLTKIGICRGDIALPHPVAHYAAVVSDVPYPDAAAAFRSNEHRAIAAWIADNKSTFTKVTVPALPTLIQPSN